MPSNQLPYRSLTRPHKASTFVSASPWVSRAGRALTIFSSIFLCLSFLFAVRSTTRDHALSYAAGAVGDRVRGGSLHKTCNPVELPGWLSLDAKTDLPVWNALQGTTTRTDCTTSRLVADLYAHAFDTSNVVAGENSIRNKTVVIVGDVATTKRRLSGLCDVIGGTRADVNAAHPWGRALRHPGRGDGLDLGSYCYLASQDLLLHHLPHPGLLRSPSFDVTLRNILPPFLSSISSSSPSDTSASTPRHRASASPDVLVWSSYEADLSEWARVDGSPLPTHGSEGQGALKLSRERLEGWGEANVRTLKTIDGLLATLGKSKSKTKLLWASGGYGDAATNGLPSSSGNSDTLPLAALSATLQSNLLPSSPLLRLSSFHGELPWSRLSSALSYLPTPALLPGVTASAEGDILQLARLTSERNKREAALWGEMVLGALRA